MKKKWMLLLLASIMVVTGSLGSVAFADDLDNQMAEVEEQKQQISTEMEEMKDDIEKAEKEVKEIQKDINHKEDEITEATNEIDDLKSEMAEREEGLNERLRAMYKNGSVGYLDVLLGANSLSEFLSNVSMIQRIYQNDQDTLKTLEEQHKVLEEKQTALEAEKAELDVQKEKEAAKKENLEASKAELQEKLDALNAEADRITAEIQARQQALEEQRRKEKEANQQDGGDNSGDSASEEDVPQYSGGALQWPCDSSLITSYFGFRIHPLTGIYTGHTGIDIGCSMNSPIYAAESGTVILAEWYGGYGYAVVIDHGGGVSTLYGHNDSLLVNVGDQVSRGDVVASSGNTGWSTGPHLHFEVRVNGEYVDPMGYF